MKNKLLLLSAVLLFLAGASSAQIDILHNFSNNETPYGSLTQSGNVFYGMTYAGGDSNKGYIFSVNKDGSNFKDIWNFVDTGTAGNANGEHPVNTLILSGHKLYGMTSGNSNFPANYGNVFSINTDGTGYKDLWDFYDTAYTIGNSNGMFPYGSLLLVRNKLYGMTYTGGYNGAGLIFSIDTNGGAFKDLLDFSQTINGGGPEGGLILIGRKLFGTTYGYCEECGRTENGLYGDGNVFSIDTDGTQYKDVYVFAGPNGVEPEGDLVASADGKRLFGTTYRGGGNNKNLGVVFGVDTDGGNFKDLLTFNDTNGAYSTSTLILSGNTLYGMASEGGSYFENYNPGFGTIYSLDTNGSAFSLIQNFNLSDGAYPDGKLTLIGDSLYGMASGGGFDGDGEIFACSAVAPAGIQNITSGNGHVSVFPNPSNGQFVISIKNNEVGTAKQVNIYNVLGEIVYSQPNIVNSTFNIDMSSQANGMYMYRVLNPNGSILGEGRVVIQK